MITETKSQLAKLLATEDITVRHSIEAKTASFDVKNRVLTLPNWKVKNDTLDMLIGHEVGHALYTLLKDWDTALEKGYHKGILNVIEDARIEKKVKRRYPGLTQRFLTGYKGLVSKGFFGNIDSDTLTEMKLIDRLNLHFKLGYSVGIPFADNEQCFVNDIEACETWADVLAIHDKLAVASLEEQEGMESFLSDTEDTDGVGLEEVSGNSREGHSDSFTEEDLDDNERAAITEELGDSETQEQFNDAVEQLAAPGRRDSQGAYFRLPKAVVSQVVVPYTKIMSYGKKCIEELNREAAEFDRRYHKINQLEEAAQEFTLFRRRSMKIVNYMAKEFERKKAASEYRKESVSKTGVLDINKIHSYKYNDDLFLRNTIRPDGKNHGMVMLMDWSASMSDKISDTVRQTLNMVWFCKKVNIPFEVYGFTNQWTDTSRIGKTRFIRRGMDDKFGGDWMKQHALTAEQKAYRNELEDIYTKEHAHVKPTWDLKPGMAHFGDKNGVENFHLLNFLSSRMSAKQLTEASKLLFLIGESNGYGGSGWESLELGSTPLLPALCSMDQILPAFRNKYRLDKTSLIVLTDGQGNASFSATVDDGMGNGTHHMGNVQNILEDEITRKNYKLADYFGNSTRSYNSVLHERVVMSMLQDRYDVSIVGLFLTDSKTVSRRDLEPYLGWYSMYKDEHTKVRKDLRKTGVATVPCIGYNEFHIVPSSKLQEKSDSLDDISEDMTVGKMKRVFSKAQNNKVGNKVLVNRLMDQIA